jgi:hypothetical protein
MTLLSVLSSFLALAVALAEIEITVQPITVYDRSPKLRIRGTGFAAQEHEIQLTFEPELIEGKDYSLDKKNDEGIILKLLAGKR